MNEDAKVNRPVEKLVADTLQYVPEIQKLFAAAH
jgi:hypothetical protein